MTSEDPNQLHTPTLALKQALCYSCWDVSSNLNRCNACKRVSYCSAKCQKQDWNKSHKKLCKQLIALNQQKEYIPSAGRHWDDYYREQELEFVRSGTLDPCELGRLVGLEPYCCHCYRRESQLDNQTKLHSCQICLLTSFCPSCPQTHPTIECATLQDISTDEKIKRDLYRRTGRNSSLHFTQFPRKEYRSLSSANDWYEYYTNISDLKGLMSKMDRELRCVSNIPEEREYVNHLRCGTNTTSMHLTLIAALEALIPNVYTRTSISIHMIDAAGAEWSSKLAFEEILHLLPMLKTLQLVLVGPNVLEHPPSDNSTQITSPNMLQCCAVCTKSERTVSISTWTPDLAAAFHTGFSVDDQASWNLTVEYLAHAPHPILFTAARYHEVKGEMRIWKNLEAEFEKQGEVNKWKGMTPSLGVCGDRPNEVTYTNHWWYIVKQK